MTRFTSLVLCSFAAFLSPVAVGAGHSINAEIAVSDAYMKPGSILSEPVVCPVAQCSGRRSEP